MRSAEPMDIDFFWRIVEMAGWESSGFDYAVCQRALRKLLPSPKELEGFRAQYDLVTSRLAVSDDGESDLVAHIVGLGRTEYEASLKKWSLIEERVIKRAYTESFSYAIPTAEMYNPGYDAERIEQARRDHSAKALQDEVYTIVLKVIEDAKLRCADLSQSPVRYHVHAGTDAALRTAFPEKVA